MDGPGYWSEEEQSRREPHLQARMKRLVGRLRFVVFVQSEIVFARDPKLRDSKANTQGGWSVWIRETHAGWPFEYNDYLDTAVHEAAHILVFRRQPQHSDESPIFQTAYAKLKEKARTIGITQTTDIPDDVVNLFRLNDTELRSERVRQCLLDVAR